MNDLKALKPWRCIHGHEMGRVMRDANGIRRLLLYRQAVDLRPESTQSLTEVDVMAVVEGYVADVQCSICGYIRTWVPGEEALTALIKRAKELQS